MGTWTLKYTTGYNANTWDSKAFATYTAGSSVEEITSISAYFGVGKNGTVYGPGTDSNTDWDTVTGNGNPCKITMFNGNSTATVSVTATCGRSGSSASGWYPTFSDTALYTWTFSTPISVAANSTVTIYFKKESGVLCNGNGSNRKGNVTGVAGVPVRYITYNANGGSGAPSQQTCTKGVATNISSTKPTKSSVSANNFTITFNKNGGNAVSPTSTTSTKTTNYTFSTWNTAADGSGNSYSAGGSITLTDNLTLYAIYTSSTVNNSISTPTATKNNGSATRTVTFDGNGGTSSSNSLSSTASITYSGSGWYTASSGGTKRCANGGSYTPSKTETVYQQWSSSTGTFSAITLPSAEQTGYSFLGWSTSSSATSASWTEGASYTPSATTTLYAVWEAENYTVTFNANGGTISSTSTTVTYGSAYGTLPTPTKSGYTFAGWYTASSGGSQITSSSIVSTASNHTLYAHWTAWTYTIAYNAGNSSATGSMSSTSHTYKDGSTLAISGFSLSGYNQIGWGTAADGAALYGLEGSAPYGLVTENNQTINLYAIWSQNTPWTLCQVKICKSDGTTWWTC